MPAGLEAQYELLTDTIALRKHTELYELSRNLNTTRTREVKIERDVCASEIGRLRMVLNHLKLLYAKAQEENGDWIMCKKHLEKLTIINPKLQKTVDSLQESVKKGKADIKAMKAKAKEAASTIKRAQSKYSSLESQISGLGSQIKSAEDTKKQKLRKLHQVGFERMKFNKQFKDENPNVSLGTKS
ncbi:hypothetical protein AXG93_4324s1030 [Marchantia polymorpha subsp. ruderalis]|uniref:Uncharacterized protein n=1 Tax=Marchantia polymorpha subsp. ruderalis TaxID=1480154 RepID=A0A176VZX0_MARPO|nr:hypothetical protein AXG93_4324s1030 [Marchantia polymorpha subsp. ruderalis]